MNLIRSTKPIRLSRSVGFSLALMGVMAVTPQFAESQVLQCEPEITVQALGGPVFLLGETVRISADIGAGAVSGSQTPPDYLDIDKFTYLLDCSLGDTFPTCTDAGNTVMYANNIVSDCVDSAGAPANLQTSIVGNSVEFTTQSGLPIRNNANTTCNVEFDVVVNGIADDNPSATIVEILGFLDTDGQCSNGLAAGESASLSFDITARRAQFRVTKDFSDDNPAGVDVHISCNTGLPLDQSQTISEFGDNGFDSVTFVVDAFDAGELDCHITEDPVPDGYSESYSAGTETGVAATVEDDAEGCHFLEVQEGLFTCEITDTLDPVVIDVTKEWYGDLESAGVYPSADADWSCQNVRSSPTDTTLGNENGSLYFKGNPDTDSTGPIYPDYDGSSVCTVVEDVSFGPVETDDSDCASLPISLGMGNSCTITNTVFFEGIPTLSQYGLAVLALLMLGVGMVGFRRYT
ncbi:IPTL-CTERM sorting domain-containing protein [Elongatibacter sediminis]|uniref:IPTL-CTERM sorting domain-containing protein n=1 Tax=Elongatibacter sediminis TaxID=3119006 RepID=A0AAW9RHS6_9GAMM